MVLQKTNRTTLVEQVALQIESLIESGHWPVGTRIPAEPELVAELGVSRNTVREAVRAMVHAGLLTTKQGDGTYVCSNSVLGVVLQRRIRQSDMLETFELRHALEKEAARLASDRRTEDDVKVLLTELSACEEAIKARDTAGFVEADIRLHKAIVEATHNGIFIEIYEHMHDALQASVTGTIYMDSLSPHRDVVEAIVERNPDKAASAVQAYIEQFIQILRQTEALDPE